MNDVALLSLLLTFNITFHNFFSCPSLNFEQLNVCWVRASDTYAAYYYVHRVSVFTDYFENLRSNGLHFFKVTDLELVTIKKSQIMVDVFLEVF